VPIEQSPDRRVGSFRLVGTDVIENGLPPLPDVITHEMIIPISYWTASKVAVVVFLRFFEGPEFGGVMPAAMNIPYYLEAGKWTFETSGLFHASGFPFDPVTEPEKAEDLDGSHFVYGTSGGLQAEGKPPAWVATGRASREVTYLAVVQAGVEDRRRLDGHFGSWVVCTEAPDPFEVVAYDSSGQTLARLPYPSRA
jgi:hypothetical protein